MQRIPYVHHGDTSSVKLVDGLLRWHTDSTHEQPRLFLDDHVDELAQLALSVVVLYDRCKRNEWNGSQETCICLAGATADLRQQEIDAERRILIFEVLLQYVNLETGSASAPAYSPSTQRPSETDLRPENFWCVPNATNDAKTTGVGNSSSELRSSSDVHPCSP